MNGLFAACSSYEFIIALVIAGKGLSIVRPATAKLQYDDIDIVKGYQEIDLLLSKCKDIRKDLDTYHKKWYDKANGIAEKVDVSPSKPRICDKQTLRDNPNVEDPESYYRIMISALFLDHLIQQLEFAILPEEYHLPARLPNYSNHNDIYNFITLQAEMARFIF